MWTWIGLAVAAGALVYGAGIVAQTLVWSRDVPGYASLMVVMLLLGAVQLVSLGVIGEYLGRLYTETKQRPLYLVRATAGFAGAAAPREGRPAPTARPVPVVPAVPVERTAPAEWAVPAEWAARAGLAGAAARPSRVPAE